MKNFFLSFVFILLTACGSSAADIKVVATSPWLAVITNFIGGYHIEATPLTNWDGVRLRGREAPLLTNESDIIALDADESNSLSIRKEEYPNLFFLYEKAPFASDEKEYYFGDPSALPFIAQRIFRALGAIDRENFAYYQRQLSVFQTRLNSSILAGRHLLRGLRVFDLTGGSGYFLVAAGCEVVMPKREDFKLWARGQQLSLLTEAMRNIGAVNGVVVIDESTPRAVITAAGANAVSVAFSRPPLNEDFLTFIHNQYLLLWGKVKDKVPAQ